MRGFGCQSTTIVTMPGDGIGNQVLPEAIRVLDAVGFEADYVHADIGWECWIKEGNALPERTIDLLRQHKSRPLRRDHLEAQERSRGRTDSRVEGQRPSILQPHCFHAAEVQPRRLHAALPVVPRQSAELHPQEACGRLRRAEGRCGGLPPEYRGPVRRRGVDQSAAASARCAEHECEVQAVRESCRRRSCDFGAHHHPSGGAPHLRSGVPARAQVRLQVSDHLREAERACAKPRE